MTWLRNEDMKTPIVAALVLSMAVASNVDLFRSAEAQADPPKVTATTPFAWTPPTQNADGTPLTDLAGYVFSVAGETDDMTVAGTVALNRVQVPADDPVCAGGECRTIPPGLFAGLPGGLYRVWVQAYDTSANVSSYSAPTVVLQWDASVPNAPTNLRPEPQPLVVINVNGDNGNVHVNIGDAVALAHFESVPESNGG